MRAPLPVHRRLAGHLPRSGGHTLSAAVLAGGRSRRMGQDKLALPFGRGTVLSTVLDTVSTISDDVFIVGRTVPGWRCVADRLEERCALSGIHAALCEARHPLVLVVAGDMPRLDTTFLRGLEPDVIPRAGGHLQPLCAVYRTQHRDLLETFWAGGGRAATAFALRIPGVRIVDAPPESFLNLNTPGDLTSLKQPFTDC